MGWVGRPEGVSPLAMQILELPSQISQLNAFRELKVSGWENEDILSSITNTTTPRNAKQSLRLLYAALTQLPGPWPAIPLIRCFARLTKLLPEMSRTNPDQDVGNILRATSNLVKGSYGSLLDFMCRDSRRALQDTRPGDFISHAGLHNFVSNFSLEVESCDRKPVVAVALPNGPLLAATCFAVATYYTCAPINPASGPGQFQADVSRLGATVILTSLRDYEKLELDAGWVTDQNIQVQILDWDGRDNIRLLEPSGLPMEPSDQKPSPNQANDTCLILFTTGTSGTKKMVPMTLHSIIAGVVFVIDSWGLGVDDVCLNMMPLFHV